MKQRMNEDEIVFSLRNYLENLKYSKKWETKKTLENKYVQSVLDHSSKRGTGERGEPDLLYVNNDKKLLILIECKYITSNHRSKDGISDPLKYAIDGIKHYLSFFLPVKLEKQNKNIFDWKIVGIAFSGNIEEKYNKRIDTFFIKKDKIKSAELKELLEEEDYENLFENIDIEEITNNISMSSKKINNELRFLDSQKRPVLLSALMVSLFDRERNDFKEHYKNQDPSTIAANIPLVVERILKTEGVPVDKIHILLSELGYLKYDQDIQNQNFLKSILDELNDNVIPLFNRKSNYDIIGKFYEEFLKYAGVANVKKGIVLTPHHITTLFSELIHLKTNDIIFDPCCGTGSFLIAGMNKIHKLIDNSEIHNKKDLHNNLKSNQLIGFEKNTTMYSLAISNMLFRGDGKSNVHNVDFFSNEALTILEEKKPTIGFMNPPYGGEGKGTKKEIQFLERMLDNTSRYGIVIAPMGMFFKEGVVRQRILSKHTLKYSINMPDDLFRPNATVQTTIGIFETNSPHGNKEVLFYDLKNDGFVLSKQKGRTDKYNKWSGIKNDLLNFISEPTFCSNKHHKLSKKISSAGDEWIIQAHSETNYGKLTNIDFERSIKEYVVFKTKSDLGILHNDIDILTLFDVFVKHGVTSDACKNKKINLDILNGGSFRYDKVFNIKKGYYNNKPGASESGEVPFIGATEFRNGITSLHDLEEIKQSSKSGNGKNHDLSSKIFKGGEHITITNNGSIGFAFFQPIDFTCSHDVNPITLKDYDLNIYIAMFLKTLIQLEQFRWTYGRKWRTSRMPDSIIKLPIDKGENPDWQFMEDYIKSLPYSSNLGD